MMVALKQFLKTNQISIRTLSAKSGIPYSTINDIVNEKTDILQMRFGYVLLIASFLSVSVEELLSLCKSEFPELADGKLIIKNKKYYLQYQSNGHTCEQPLTSVNDKIRPFIKDLARWTIDEIREKELMKSWQLHIT